MENINYKFVFVKVMQFSPLPVLLTLGLCALGMSTSQVLFALMGTIVIFTAIVLFAYGMANL